MTYEKQLDEALEYLRDNIAIEGTFLYYDKRRADANNQAHYLFKHLKEIGVKDQFWLPLIYYLDDDKYIDLDWQPKEEEAAHNPPNQLKITFRGIMFINSGGYSQKKINDDAQNNRLEKLEQSQKDYQNYIVWLTGILALGTTVAGVYYFLEIYDTHLVIAYYLLGLISGILLAALVWSIFQKRKKSKDKQR